MSSFIVWLAAIALPHIRMRQNCVALDRQRPAARSCNLVPLRWRPHQIIRQELPRRRVASLGLLKLGRAAGPNRQYNPPRAGLSTVAPSAGARATAPDAPATGRAWTDPVVAPESRSLPRASRRGDTSSRRRHEPCWAGAEMSMAFYSQCLFDGSLSWRICEAMALWESSTGGGASRGLSR